MMQMLFQELSWRAGIYKCKTGIVLCDVFS